MAGRFTEPTTPVWACVDCYALHCNGETSPDMTEQERADFLARYAAGTADCEVTAGMLAEHHSCQNAAGEIAYQYGSECECEDQDFSWSACGICGSTLGGSRHALTLWVAA